MELQKLRYFYTVAQLQHVTKAAQQLNIAQPALSQAIRSLEQELDVKLFIKNGRNIELTQYGDYLLNRLEAVLPEFDSIKEGIDKMKKRVNKTIKLNILAASTFVIDAIVDYRKLNPDAVFDFEQNEERQDCDIVITTNGIEHKSMTACRARSLNDEQIFLVVPRISKYSECESLKLSDVQKDEFVMLSSSRRFGAICQQLCADAGFYPKILFESDSPTAVQNIISTGTGVAFWPEYSWGELVNDNVMLLPISNPECKREIIIEWYDRLPRSEYAEDFYKFLTERIKHYSRPKS